MVKNTAAHCDKREHVRGNHLLSSCGAEMDRTSTQYFRLTMLVIVFNGSRAPSAVHIA